MKKALFITMALVGLTFSAQAEEAKCPISGEPVDASVTLNVNGKEVAFCCEKCEAKFEEALHVTDEGVGKCPISGKDAVATTKVLHSVAETVYTCCAKCLKKYTEENKISIKDEGAAKCALNADNDADAAVFVVHNGEKKYFCCDKCKAKYSAANNVVMIDKGPEKCPVSGEDADAEQSVVHVKTTAKYFCCENCQAKYIEKEFAAATE